MSGLNPQAVANALTEGVGIAMESNGIWISHCAEPKVKNSCYFEDTWQIGRIAWGLKIDYSGDWKDSWTPKLLQGEQDALDMIEGEKALLKQEQETEQKYCYKRENGYVCNKPLPCPVHAEKKDK